MRYRIWILMLFMLFQQLLTVAQANTPNGALSFKSGSLILQNNYKSNGPHLEEIERWFSSEYQPDNSAGGYIRIIAHYAENNNQAMNQAAIKASIFASHLRSALRGKTLRYTFYLRQSAEVDEIEYTCVEGAIPDGACTQISYTNNPSWIKKVIDSYPAAAFIDQRASVPAVEVMAPFTVSAPTKVAEAVVSVPAEERPTTASTIVAQVVATTPAAPVVAESKSAESKKVIVPAVVASSPAQSTPVVTAKSAPLPLINMMKRERVSLPKGTIEYIAGSTIMLSSYKENGKHLKALEQWLKKEYRPDDASGGYVRIVAVFSDNNLYAMNQSAILASTFASYFRQQVKGGNLRYTFNFRFGDCSECVSFECHDGAIPDGANTEIKYTNKKNWVKRVIDSYPMSAFVETNLDNSEEESDIEQVIVVNPDRQFIDSLLQVQAALGGLNTPTGLPNAGQVVGTRSDGSSIYPTTVSNTSVILNRASASQSRIFSSRPDLAKADVREVDILIYYRYDKSTFDTTYLSNPRTLYQIDSLMRLPSSLFIDSLRVVGHASPEGSVEYNRRLSMRRAQSMREYLIKRFPGKVSPNAVISEAGGENWEGFRKMAERDEELPMKETVLSILNNRSIDDQARQKQIELLDNGTLYNNYLLPKYYSYLRSGASLLFVYNPKMPKDINSRPRFVSVLPATFVKIDSLVPIRLNIKLNDVIPDPNIIRPIAIKSNLLADAATLLNLELEVPIKRHFSVLLEWSFPFWGGLGNDGGVAPIPAYSENYTLQMLAGHVEARYWFNRSRTLDKKARQYQDFNPLNGWFVGAYGGSGLYDFQWRYKGIQGEFFISSGLTVGYAHPITRTLHLEYSAAFGYLQTQYYNYSMKNGHKVVDVRDDGIYDRRQQSYFGMTKAKISLVWIPQYLKSGKMVK